MQEFPEYRTELSELFEFLNKRNDGDAMEGNYDMCKAVIDLTNKGRAEGITQGRTETSIEYISNIMSNLNLSAEEAMKILSIPKEEYAKYLKMLLEK